MKNNYLLLILFIFIIIFSCSDNSGNYGSISGQFKVVNQWGTGPSWENVDDGFLYITYEAMIQSNVLCLFIEDRASYEPVYLIRFEISHPSRSDCKIKVGVQEDDGTLIDEKDFNGYMATSGGTTWTNTEMVVDVTEFASYFALGDVFLEVYDLDEDEYYDSRDYDDKYSYYQGTNDTGTITWFEIEKYSVYTSTIKTLESDEGGAESQATTNKDSVKLTIDTNGGNPIGSPPKASAISYKSSRIQELFNVRHLTSSEISNLKNTVGVYDSSKNYNIVINGFGTGFKPPTEEHWEKIQTNYLTIDSIKSSTILSSLPSAGDFSTTNYFPPIGHQGGEGSCASWATAYYTKTYQEAIEHGWDLSGSTLSGLFDNSDPNKDKIFSPDFLYHQVNEGSMDGGSFFDDNVRIIDVVGCATWDTMRTYTTNSTNWPDTPAWEEAAMYRGELNTSSQDWGAAGGYWFYVADEDDINIIRLLLDNDIPVVIGVDAYKYPYLDSTDTWTTSNYTYPSINHANTIIGYEDN